jgi:hypothetical protein
MRGIAAPDFISGDPPMRLGLHPTILIRPDLHR